MKAFMDEGFSARYPHGPASVRRLRGADADHGLPLPHQPQGDLRRTGFDDITQAWLGGDHYKWRVMRAQGVDETYITGDASDREKFEKWAEIMPMPVGNPLYHWTHLELKRFFGMRAS